MESDDKKVGKVDMAQIFSEEEMTFDYYSCEQAINRLNEYLDHELVAGERATVIKHLQICRPCLERFRFEETLMVSIRTKIAGLSAPGSLKSKLSAMIRGDR